MAGGKIRVGRETVNQPPFYFVLIFRTKPGTVFIYMGAAMAW